MELPAWMMGGSLRAGASVGVVLLASATLGCGGDAVKIDTTPIVSIYASDTIGIEPMTVQFFSTVSGGNGALRFAWDFGDDESSEEPNPRHAFGAATGPYVVRLTVTDEDGDSATSSVQVSVGSDEVPSVLAQATPISGKAPLAVDFGCTTAGGNGDVSVVWRFGQGDGADSASATHTYLLPGVYVARCEALDADGDAAGDSLTVTVDADGVPEAALSLSPVGGVAPLSVNFVGAAIGGDGTPVLTWDFGDGGGASGAVVTHVYAEPGSYTAILTVADEDGDEDFQTFNVVVTAAVE